MDAPPSPPELCIGRETELSQLFAVYGDLGMGHSRIALLQGPRGIGKTSILREFRSRVRLDGGVVLEGRCEPGQPYGPFAAVLEAALAFLSEVGAPCAADLSALACRSGCHRLWFHHDGGSDEETPLATPALLPGHMEGDHASERRHRFYEAVLGVIRDVAAVRPPVIMLHDLERANHGTVGLLRHILDSSLDPGTALQASGPRTWFLVGSVARDRDLVDAQPFAAFAEKRGAAVIEVGDLDIDGVKAYLHSPHTLDRIIQRTGGSPEAIDRLLAAQPLSPEEMLSQQLEAMLPDARPLLYGLAVIEDEADLELIAQVTGATIDANCRKSFWGSPLLEHRVADGRILFRFRKMDDRLEVLSRIDAGQRRDLHGRAATAYSERPQGELRAARHAIAAGDEMRAVALSLEAARTLAARHAHKEAASLLEEALELGDGKANVIPRTYLTELYRIAGDYPTALRHAEAVARTHPESADAARHVGHLLMLSGQLDAAAHRFEAAYRLAHSEGDEPLRVEVEAFLAELGYQRNAYDEAREWAERAMEESERLRLNAWHVHSRNTMGKLALAQGDAAEAARLFSANLAQASDCGLAHHQAQALTNLGVTYLRQQRLREAEETFARAVDVAAAAHDTREQAIATENLAVLAHLRRDYGTALRRYHSAVSMLKGLGNRSMLARAANNLGELYLSLGNSTRARSLCDFATHVGGTSMSPTITAEGLLLRGRIERVEAQNDAARVSFEAAHRQLQDLGSERRFDVQIELARLVLADGHVGEARKALAQIPAQESPKRATEIALLTCDIERAAGASLRSAAEIAMGLAERIADDELLLPALTRMASSLIDDGGFSAAATLIERAQNVEARMSRNLPEEAHRTWSTRTVRRELTHVANLLEAASAEAGLEISVSRSDHYSSKPPLSSLRSAHENEAVFSKFPNIVGRSAPVRRLLTLLAKVAPTDALVLIRGESGTGKELIAEALHEGSARRHRPLIKVNCAALVETLLLSELFGHEKGAFTGANARKKGRFELADGGTIFLDEIGDISAKTQVALLRVLQERQFERVGGTDPIRVNVRIIAATHRDLEAMVADGAFREDLYYRLRGVVIESPPLRERSHDVERLASHLLAKIAQERGDRRHELSPEAVGLLSHHRWPGNIRELENVLRSATLFADGQCLKVADFQAFRDLFQAGPEDVEPLPSGNPAPPEPLEDTVYGMVRGGTLSLAEMKKGLERECIVRALDETSGNITRAAELLGMKRPRLSQLVKQYDLLAEARKR